MLAPHRRRIVMGEAGGTFEVAQHRIERAVGMIGRALQAGLGVRLAGDAGQHGFAQAGFCRGPASPDSKNSWPSPPAAIAQRSSTSASSTSRPTKAAEAG